MRNSLFWAFQENSRGRQILEGQNNFFFVVISATWVLCLQTFKKQIILSIWAVVIKTCQFLIDCHFHYAMSEVPVYFRVNREFQVFSICTICMFMFQKVAADQKVCFLRRKKLSLSKKCIHVSHVQRYNKWSSLHAKKNLFLTHFQSVEML